MSVAEDLLCRRPWSFRPQAAIKSRPQMANRPVTVRLGRGEEADGCPFTRTSGRPRDDHLGVSSVERLAQCK